MIIRRATSRDAAAVTRVFLAARRDAMPYLPELHTDEETASFVRSLTRDRETYLADIDGEVAGFAVVHDGLLEHLYVAPARQGKGSRARTRRFGGLTRGDHHVPDAQTR